MTMKKILVALFAFASLAGAAPTKSQSPKGNIGQSIALFGAQRNAVPVMGAVVNLDTSEIDTSYFFYDLTDKPVTGALDTVGWLHFAHKDSTGSDSDRVRVIWYGNSRADGGGLWTKIDSVTASGNAITTFTAATPTAVINSKGYMALMFTVGNPSNSAVALKSVAKDIVLNRPKNGRLFTP
jgi:hypothetical protein